MKKKLLISTGGSGGHTALAGILFEHLCEKNDITISSDERGLRYLGKDIKN